MDPENTITTSGFGGSETHNMQTESASLPNASSTHGNSTTIGNASNNEDEIQPDMHHPIDREIIDLEEKRRRECLGNMEKIEKEFADLKEKFFTDKIDSLKKEYDMIKIGTHQGFIKKCKELEDIKEYKLWAAEKWKEFQYQNLENVFEAEKLQAEEEFKADKKALREKMLQLAQDRKRKLAEEKSTVSITGTTGTEQGNEKVARTLRKRAAEKATSREQGGSSLKRRAAPNHINYTLKESEINEDLSLIQKAIALNPGSFLRVPIAAPEDHVPSSKQSALPLLLPSQQQHHHQHQISLPPSTQQPQQQVQMSSTSINITITGTGGGGGGGSSSASGGAGDVYTDKGKLYYHNVVFEKGKEVLVYSTQEKWQGTLVVVNPAEIHIKNSDGIKSRFTIPHLRTGKTTISLIQ